MNRYAIGFKNTDRPLITIEADLFRAADGFFQFFKYGHDFEEELFACHSADIVAFCVLQNEFTTEEIIQQITNQG